MNNLFDNIYIESQEFKETSLIFDVFIDFNENDQDFNKIVLKLYKGTLNDSEIFIEAADYIKQFKNVSESLSCYYSTSINLYRKGFKPIDIEQIIKFTSNSVLECITASEKLKEVWDKFIELSKEEEDNFGIIVGSGMASSLTFLLEHLKIIAFKEGIKAEVVKSSVSKFDMANLDSKLPKKVVLLLGGSYENEDKLDYEMELEGIYTSLGQKSNFNYDQIMYMGDTLEYNDNFKRISIEIIPPSASLTDIDDIIKNINERYILIYSGHGIDDCRHNGQTYPYGYLDGKIGIRRSKEEKSTVSHKEFSEIFISKPPEGIIFNCCSSLRGMECCGSEVFESSYNNSYGFESCYFKFTGYTTFISASRTKIRDEFAAMNTINIIKSIFEEENIRGMLKILTKYQYQLQEMQVDDKDINKIVRDSVSSVFWML